MTLTVIAATCVSIVLASCGTTTVGTHTKERVVVDYGAPATLNVCLLRNERVPVERATALVAAVNAEFAPYGIHVEVPWMRPWVRPGFGVDPLMSDIVMRELEAPCDRLMGLVDRNAGDFAWGLLLPELLGYVEYFTHTRGYVVAVSGSLNQLFLPPSEVVVHEFYHLLGCPHAETLTACYHRIAELKAKIDPTAGFFPGVTPKGDFLLTREAANAELKAAIDAALAKQRGAHSAPASASAPDAPPPSR